MKYGRKSRGQNFTAEEASELVSQLVNQLGTRRGFSSAGQSANGDDFRTRARLVQGKVSEDLEPWSIVHSTGILTGGSNLNLTPRFLMEKRGSATSMYGMLFANESLAVAEDSIGRFLPLSHWCSTLVRGSATEADEPLVNEPCGLEPTTGFLSNKFGGLLCIADGYTANVEGDPKNLFAVVQQPHQWWWGQITSKDVGANTYEVEMQTPPEIFRDCVCHVAPADSGTDYLPDGAVVKVEVNQFTGQYHITERIGC